MDLCACGGCCPIFNHSLLVGVGDSVLGVAATARRQELGNVAGCSFSYESFQVFVHEVAFGCSMGDVIRVIHC